MTEQEHSKLPVLADSKDLVPLKEFDDVVAMRKIIAALWDVIDDIDTYSDMAKTNDVMFRNLVEKKQAERWLTPVTSDGYHLYCDLKVIEKVKCLSEKATQEASEPQPSEGKPYVG